VVDMPWWLNEMDPVEAFEMLLRGEKPDRVVNCPMCLGHAAKLLGYKSLGELYEFPKVWMKAMIVAKEMYNIYPPPLTVAGTGPMNMGAWGSKYMLPYHPKMGAIALTEPRVKTPEDVDSLQIPDPAPYMSGIDESIELGIKHKMHPLAFVIGGWVSGAGYGITEPEKILFWIRKRPDLVDRLLDASAEYAIRILEHLVKKFGPENWIPWDANPTDSNTILDADTFGKFPLPRVIKIHQKGLDLGIPLWFTHWCSKHDLNIKAGYVEKVPQGKPGILSFGPEVPLDLQVERFGNYILLGNLDPPQVMNRTNDEVKEMSRKNIEIGMRGKAGYMLACGCELPPPVPPANVFAMTSACREYGKYQK